MPPRVQFFLGSPSRSSSQHGISQRNIPSHMALTLWLSPDMADLKIARRSRALFWGSQRGCGGVSGSTEELMGVRGWLGGLGCLAGRSPRIFILRLGCDIGIDDPCESFLPHLTCLPPSPPPYLLTSPPAPSPSLSLSICIYLYLSFTLLASKAIV